MVGSADMDARAFWLNLFTQAIAFATFYKAMQEKRAFVLYARDLLSFSPGVFLCIIFK